MSYNQPYKPLQKLALHFICKAGFGLFFMVFGFSFGQLYVSDSTVLVLGEGAFISEEIKEEKGLIIYIAEGTKTVNFPTQGNFVGIDKNESRKSEPKEIILSERTETEILLKEVQSVKSEVEDKTQKFIWIAKSTDRAIFTANLHYAVGVVQVNSYSKNKSVDTQLSNDFVFFVFLTTSKEIKRQDVWRENKVVSSLFAPRGPPIG